MKKSVKNISIFLGVSMLAFGTLKFINPFKLWYKTQVVTSELPFQQFSYWAGQLGEILSGLALIILVLFQKRIPKKSFYLGFTLINVSIAFMMLVAIYVHTHPDVPNDVLPLKIKPPFIPVLFMVLAILNSWLNKSKIKR
ncbi:hypothetical protein [Jiulongibacter sp. NS-SX5]|uniref:hypothetical protein n=1 Tax=Jiulongibacter sp. NS-SX5 TaxID=3463854 RepID=UPI00405916A8